MRSEISVLASALVQLLGGSSRVVCVGLLVLFIFLVMLTLIYLNMDRRSDLWRLETEEGWMERAVEVERTPQKREKKGRCLVPSLRVMTSS